MAVRSGSKTKKVMFRGKMHTYTTILDLSKKLGISQIQARGLISPQTSGRRLVKTITGQVEVIDFKKENPLGLLTREFNIKRIRNKDLIEGKFIPSKGVEILKETGPEEDVVGLTIMITMYITYGSPYSVSKADIMDGNKIDYAKLQEHLSDKSLYEKTTVITYNGIQKDLSDAVREAVLKYVGGSIRRSNGKVVIYKYRVGSSYANRTLKFEKGYIRDFDNEYELTEWANIQYDYKNKKGDSCAVSYISERFPDLYWNIKSLEEKDGIGITVQDFRDFCSRFGIDCIIYNERGNKLFDDRVRTDNRIGNVVCIIYNNHIYPVHGGKPVRVNQNKFEVKVVPNIKDKFEKLLEKKKLPANIKISDVMSKICRKTEGVVDVISYTMKGKKYIGNPEYIKCKEIVKKIGPLLGIDGLENNVKDNVRLVDIFRIIEKAMKVRPVTSFFPEKDNFKTPPLYFKSSKEMNRKRIVSSIDKNKCYSYCLAELKYLIMFDWRKHSINRNPDIDNMKDSNLYIAKPKKWSIVMPCTKLYAGYHLRECRDMGVEFELLEELETVIAPNHYTKIIKLMFENMDEKDFKEVMNIVIGKFERDIQNQFTYSYDGLYNEESSTMFEGFTTKVGDHTLFFKESIKMKYSRDKLPIATQVKDFSRMLVAKKIRELGLRDEDIIQINTDSITFYGSLPHNLDRKKFDSWKEIEYKDIGDVDMHEMYDANMQNPPTLIDLENKYGGERKLYMKYAGSGKTTMIIKKLIPKITKKKESYIVLTPTHSSLDELKKNGINCDIVHRYTFSDTIPEEDNIIFDEIGFADLSCHDLLYKLVKKEKNITCFGDFNQLLPVGEDRPCNQQHYLEYMFQEIDDGFVNHRNNFTKEYYDDLINGRLDLQKEVNRHSTEDMYKAEVILCYRTEKSSKFKTREEYNNKMLKHLGLKPTDIGVKLICIDNSLIHMDIYNHKRVTIFDTLMEDGKKYYMLCDDMEELFLVSEKELKHFRPAYAINVYEAQGMTLKSYHWAKEDNVFLTQNSGNMAYTIISRLSKKGGK